MMKVRGFITHKKAEKYEDCQDYFAINKEKGRLAISDGMSQSIFPLWWAEELVHAYVDNDWLPDQSKLMSLRENWQNRVNEFLESQKQNGKPTWMLENCLTEKRGAGATFCGICFKNDKEWDGYVLGDSCLIEIDSNNHITKIYRTGKEEFNNNPDYFDSIIGGKGEVDIISGTLEKGVKLLLVTDALAEFLYSKKGNETEYVCHLLQIEKHDEFCELIDEWRESESLHNDDTTLVIIEYDESTCLEIFVKDDLANLCDTLDNRAENACSNAADDDSKGKKCVNAWIDSSKNSANNLLEPQRSRLLSTLLGMEERVKIYKNGQTSEM